MRLNSSKHPHKPDWAKPLKIFPVPLWSIWSLQLKTTTYFPKVLPRSLVVSVFPVPAGPAGAPPSAMPSACERLT